MDHETVSLIGLLTLAGLMIVYCIRFRSRAFSKTQVLVWLVLLVCVIWDQGRYGAGLVVLTIIWFGAGAIALTFS